MEESRGGSPTAPVLLCTYRSGSDSVVVRLVPADAASGVDAAHIDNGRIVPGPVPNGGLEDGQLLAAPGLGSAGILEQQADDTWLAFKKSGWLVWIVAKPAVAAHSLLLIGQVAYRNLPAIPPPISPWSAWQPPTGSTQTVMTAIAAHVGAEYRLSGAGAMLVQVVAVPFSKLYSSQSRDSISAIAMRKTPTTPAAEAEVFETTGIYAYRMCGGGKGCAIAGKPTALRGRLVSREALELALYTFKFVPEVGNSLAVLLPPTLGSPTVQFAQYFKRSLLSPQISRPLDNTLPLTTPPLPGSLDKAEATTIDKLTLPSLYEYLLSRLQDHTILAVLNAVPATSKKPTTP